MDRNDAILSILTFFLFLIITFIYQLLMPFGDEPDFGYRLYHLLKYSEQPFFSPYPYIENIIELLRFDYNCEYSSTPFGVLSSLDFNSCSQSYYQAIIRTFIGGLVIAPIFILYAFRSSFTLLLTNRSEYSIMHFYDKTRGLLYSTTFVSFVYYFNVLGVEQFLLLITVLLVTFIDVPVMVAILLVMILTIDFGDGLVVATFVSYYYFSRCVSLSKLKLSAIIILTFCFVVGPNILSIISSIGISSHKVGLMTDAYQGESSVADKYPVILRPIITYMTFIMYTPHMLKSPFAYIISAYFLFLLYERIKFEGVRDYDQKLFIVSTITILSFVFMFPGYSNAKYYIFLLPIYFSLLTKYMSGKDFVFMSVVIHISVILPIILSYLNYYLP